MSMYSGKCDLWDTVAEIRQMTDADDWSRLEIVQEGKVLDIKSLKDLIKYAPYLIGSGISSKEYTRYRIRQEPFLDTEERERLKLKLDWVKQIYRRCKRKGLPFIPEEVGREIGWHDVDRCAVALAERVAKHPYTKDISGLTMPIFDMYREEWLSGMMAYGYSEEEARQWIYGKRQVI